MDSKPNDVQHSQVFPSKYYAVFLPNGKIVPATVRNLSPLNTVKAFMERIARPAIHWKTLTAEGYTLREVTVQPTGDSIDVYSFSSGN